MNYPRTFELPTTDALTGLVTAAYFRHLLAQQLTGAAASGDLLSLVLLDLDNFADRNSEYGHECGDAILEGTARVLREALPETAVISRYGGDEFAVALLDTRLDDAFTLMEEVRRRIAALHWEEWPEVKLTCSVGLAAYPANGGSEVELMREADQALYTAKVTGRNKISLPLADSRMITKTSHYTATQLERLAQLAKSVKRNEASVLREALDDVLKKYTDRLGTPAQVG
ncbi:MAG: GGDEF domain-containing protein [Chloroflexia bacterium]